MQCVIGVVVSLWMLFTCVYAVLNLWGVIREMAYTRKMSFSAIVGLCTLVAGILACAYVTNACLDKIIGG